MEPVEASAIKVTKPRKISALKSFIERKVMTRKKTSAKSVDNCSLKSTADSSKDVKTLQSDNKLNDDTTFSQNLDKTSGMMDKCKDVDFKSNGQELKSTLSAEKHDYSCYSDVVTSTGGERQKMTSLGPAATAAGTTSFKLRAGSKWRVAQRVIGMMDENRASTAKQDLADIVKMFQRINAQKLFDDLDTAAQLRDIPSCQLQRSDTEKTFEGLDLKEDSIEEEKGQLLSTKRDHNTERRWRAIYEAEQEGGNIT